MIQRPRGDTRIQRYRTYRIQGYRIQRHRGLHGYSDTGHTGYRNTGYRDPEGIHGYRDTGHTGYRDPGGYTDTEIQDIQVQYTGITGTWLQGTGIQDIETQGDTRIQRYRIQIQDTDTGCRHPLGIHGYGDTGHTGYRDTVYRYPG